VLLLLQSLWCKTYLSSLVPHIRAAKAQPPVKYPSIAEKLSGMKDLTPESVNMITLALARVGLDCDQVDIYNHEFESLTYGDLIEPPLSLTDTEAYAVAQLLPSTQWTSECTEPGVTGFCGQVVSSTGGQHGACSRRCSLTTSSSARLHAMLDLNMLLLGYSDGASC
jgi:hypothetical protein